MTESAVHLHHFLDALFQYGAFWVYATLFVACFIENVFPPFPGDTFIVAAGGLVAIDRLDPIVSLLACAAGGMTSIVFVYTVGRRYGRDYVIRKNFKYFSAADVERIEQRLTKWGALILILSRFVIGVRSAISLAAGIGRYPIHKMFAYSLISYLLFAGTLMYLSAKVVDNVAVIERYFILYNKIIWPILGILLAAYVVFKYRKMRKSS